MLIEDLRLTVKDTKGFITHILIPNIIVVTSHGGNGVIIIESLSAGTFAFVIEDCKFEVYADREYVMTKSDLYNLADMLGLTEDSDD